MLAYWVICGKLELFMNDTTMPKLSKHQLKLIIGALEIRRTHEVCNSKWYNEYTDVIIALKNYDSSIAEASELDWNDFWSSNGLEQTYNSMY